jgi:hypothetical protein
MRKPAWPIDLWLLLERCELEARTDGCALVERRTSWVPVHGRPLLERREFGAALEASLLVDRRELGVPIDIWPLLDLRGFEEMS